MRQVTALYCYPELQKKINHCKYQNQSLKINHTMKWKATKENWKWKIRAWYNIFSGLWCSYSWHCTFRINVSSSSPSSSSSSSHGVHLSAWERTADYKSSVYCELDSIVLYWATTRGINKKYQIDWNIVHLHLFLTNKFWCKINKQWMILNSLKAKVYKFSEND